MRPGLAVLLAGMWCAPYASAQLEVVSDLVREGRAALNLSGGEVVALPLPAGGVAQGRFGFEINLPLAGANRLVVLEPYSIRSPDYRLVVQQADGSYLEHAPGPEQTFRGSVADLPGSHVAAAWHDDGLRAVLHLPDSESLWLEPLSGRVAGAAPGAHMLYQQSDVIAAGHECELLGADDAVAHFHRFTDSTGHGGSVAGDDVPWYAEIAFDADYEYFVKRGSSVANVEAQISAILNAVNVQYERDVNIRMAISTIVVRTAEPTPYTSTIANLLLGQFRTHWNTSQTHVHRDVAQLFTGKTLSGTTIGVAWLGSNSTVQGDTLCGSYGYSVVESDCNGCGSFAFKTDLTAHELGHNWGTAHIYDACPCPAGQNCQWTMNCAIVGANRFHAEQSIPNIVAFRDTRTCLDHGDTLQRVVVTSGASLTIDSVPVQFFARAHYVYEHQPQGLDITTEATWSVEPPEAGSISGTGLFVPAAGVGQRCATIVASYTDLGAMRQGQRKLDILDVSLPLALLSSDPPDGAIDARQPTDQEGNNAEGWKHITLTFNGQTCNMTPVDFNIEQSTNVGRAPSIQEVIADGTGRFEVVLNGHIQPGAWTTVTHLSSGIQVRVGYLPGDVNGDRTASPADILALIDALNGVGPPRAIWSLDVDRSGEVNPADILAVIDLLNGAGAHQPWLNVSLPD